MDRNAAEAISGLITALCHYADRHGIPFEQVLAASSNAYLSQRTSEEHPYNVGDEVRLRDGVVLSPSLASLPRLGVVAALHLSAERTQKYAVRFPGEVHAMLFTAAEIEPADDVLVRQLTGPAFPKPLFGDRSPYGRLDLAVGHRIGVQQQGEEQLARERSEVVLVEQADGDGAPQAAGVGEEVPAFGGQRQRAARPAGQPQPLDEVAQLAQVEQVVLGPRRAGKVPPEPVCALLDELLAETAGLGEGDTGVQLVQQPAQPGKRVSGRR